jgi:putative phosphonate metabolism protein
VIDFLNRNRRASNITLQQSRGLRFCNIGNALRRRIEQTYLTMPPRHGYSIGGTGFREERCCMGGSRYAIYFVPDAQSDLYRCGSAIIGYDCYTGRAVDFPAALKRDAPDWRDLTSEPRRYGFHATLKAPFRLREPNTETQLIHAVENFARHRAGVRIVKPVVRPLDGFIAIVPAEPVAALDALATACTTSFDCYRAPISPQERERRMMASLSERQIENLDRWGYPYVLSDFRFHMTLTGNVETARREAVLALLDNCVRRMGGDQPILVDRLALVKQDSTHASFKVVSQAALGGG